MPLGSDDPSPGPLADMSGVRRFTNATGVSTDISPSPYNAATDIDTVDDSVNSEDLAWRLKRGTPEYEEWARKQMAAVELQDANDGDSGSGSSDTSEAAGGRKGSDRASGRKLRFMLADS